MPPHPPTLPPLVSTESAETGHRTADSAHRMTRKLLVLLVVRLSNREQIQNI